MFRLDSITKTSTLLGIPYFDTCPPVLKAKIVSSRAGWFWNRPLAVPDPSCDPFPLAQVTKGSAFVSEGAHTQCVVAIVSC